MGLEKEDMYPEWRRQALEETYLLFYNDALQAGGPTAIQQLPPPPKAPRSAPVTRPKKGRPSRTRQTPPTRSPEKVSGSFENGSLWRQERWEYEVRKMHASRAPYSPTVGVEPIVNASELGHEIIAKKHSARYCSCSVNPLNNIMDIMSSAAPTEELDREARSLNQVSPPSKAQAKPASTWSKNLGSLSSEDSVGPFDSVSQVGLVGSTPRQEESDGRRKGRISFPPPRSSFQPEVIAKLREAA